MNRYVIAEVLQSDAVVTVLRREIRRLFESVKTSDEELRTILTNDVLKRDTLDGDPPKAAKTLVKKAIATLAKKQGAKAAAVVAD